MFNIGPPHENFEMACGQKVFKWFKENLRKVACLYHNLRGFGDSFRVPLALLL